jgi:hypothetical protein
MTDTSNITLGVDVVRYAENRAKCPPERLLTYAGRHIAWNADGTQIVASAYGNEALLEELVRLGIDPGQVVFDYVDPLDDEIDDLRPSGS